MREPETIHDKFAGFDPDVDDAHIHEGWEKIKFFVPQKEKKRRGLFFLLFGCAGAAGLAFLLMVIFFIITNNEEGNEEVTTSLPSMGESFTDSVKTIRDTGSSGSKRASEKVAEKIQTTIHQKVPDTEWRTTQNRSVLKSGLTVLDNQKSTGPEPNQKKQSEVRLGKQIVTHQVQDGGNIQPRESEQTLVMLGRQGVDTMRSISLVPRKVLVQDTVSGTPDLIPTSGDTFSVKAIGKNKRFFTEVYSGTGVSFSEISVYSGNAPVKSIAPLVIAGIGAGYRITKRVDLLFQVSVVHSDVKYSQWEQRNKEVFRTKIAVSSTIGGDSIGYVKAQTLTDIKRGMIYNVGMGLSYELVKWNRLSLSLSGGLNMGWQTIKHERIYALGTDTMVYITSPVAGDLPEKAPADFQSGTHRNSNLISRIGVSVGMDVSWRISNRYQLLLRPQYLLGLTQGAVNIGNRQYRLQQNYVVLGVGARVFF
ncbi:MAG: hypothetical protein QM534_03480 [Sediminibacterium sp.]|nr:hypothetical protein [Sediminibacterium sp.]